MINLSDGEIARLFTLTEEIAAVKKEVPAPPRGFATRQEVQEETARTLRVSLEQHSQALSELRNLLVLEESKAISDAISSAAPGVTGTVANS